MSANIELRTVPFDARFPNQNQVRNCWQNYVDYYKCFDAKGEDFAPCQQFKVAFRTLCPTKWIERWDEQRENNVFPGLHRETKHAEAHH